jgi:uncharacterized protein YqeY
MATIKETNSEKMKTAMKSGDKDLVGFTRNRKKEIDDKVELDDAAVQKLISTAIKQRQDSIEQFTKGDRMDLVAKEKAELDFLMAYMPKPLDEAELRKIIDWAVTESKASGPKDMGNVMKLLMPKVSGKADGKLVNQLVKERIG